MMTTWSNRNSREVKRRWTKGSQWMDLCLLSGWWYGVSFWIIFDLLVGGMRVVRLLLSNTLELLLVGRKDLGQGPSFPPLKWV